VAGYALLALSTDGLFHFRQRYALEIGETVVNGLRADIFAKVHARQPMSFFHRVKLGRIIGRVTSDVESLRVGIQDVLFVSAIQFGSDALHRPSHGVRLGAVPRGAGDGARAVGAQPAFPRALSRYTRASQESFSRVTATLAESVNGIRVTQGFVRQETNAGLFRSLLADHSRYNIALARTSAILTPLLELNSQFFVAILLMFGGWRCSMAT
jgi:ATP-binding cassette subfamily B protein